MPDRIRTELEVLDERPTDSCAPTGSPSPPTNATSSVYSLRLNTTGARYPAGPSRASSSGPGT